ncbi:MAG: ADP-ribose pyrophosphatase [Actinobacteria bacterium ADurb.Bin444]|nr:MAG: ADP-ribose pyrophosphatase [Actinobacteria bacterium ADurb.Bin444]
MDTGELGRTGDALRLRRPELLESRLAYRGGLIKVRVDRLALPGGREFEREVVDHPGAVVVVALDDQDRIVLAHQYRHALGTELLELPAGLLESGEDALEAAQRELREEAGLEAHRWDHLGAFYSSPGFVHELLQAFLARDLVKVERNLDLDEDIELEWVPRTALVHTPTIVEDGKTLAAVMLTEALLRAERAAS